MDPAGRSRASGIAAASALAAVLVAAPGAQATFPGQNGLIVVEAATDDGAQLFTLKPDGTDMRQITHVPTEQPRDNPGASKPDWSPDGRTIVFVENDCQIAFIDADGSNFRAVPAEPGHTIWVDECDADPSFTPDGRSIVYSRGDADSEDPWLMRLDGTGRTPLTELCNVDPNVSPDGTRLSCMGDADEVRVMDMDGSGGVQVSPPGIAWKHDWAPDGSALLFATRPTPSDSINIATVAPDGSGLRWLTDVGPGMAAQAGSYSPDGASIIFRLARGGQYALARMAADGSGVEQLTEYSATWPGLDGVSWDTGHNPQIDWGAAPTE